MRERGWQNARGLVPLEADRMGRGRRWAAAVAALALLALGLFALGPCAVRLPTPRAEGEGSRPGVGANAPPPAHLEPGVARPAPTTARADAPDALSVEIDARTEDGAPATLVVYAGTRPASGDVYWKVPSGESKVVEVPETYVHWFAYVDTADPSAEVYESASARVEAPRERARVTLRLPRARGVLTVTARDDSGNPIAGVVLELNRASKPERTRRTTGTDGRASWEELPGDFFSTSGVTVVSAPTGYRVRGRTFVEVTRDASPPRAIGTCEILLDECTAGFDLDMADVRLAWGLLERWSGASWERVPQPYLEIDPSQRYERPLFDRDASPRPGRLRGRSLRAGTYRLTAIGIRGVVGIATLTLAAREITTARLPPLETARVAGRVVGPARGSADLLELRVVDGVGAAAPMTGQSLGLLVERDGTFEGLLPLGVGRVAITVAGGDDSTRTSWVIRPSVRTLGTGLEIESLRPASIRGRLVDAKGKGLAKVGVWASLQASDPSDLDVLTTAGAMGIRGEPTKEDGRFSVGPGCPGTWHLYVSLRKRSARVREILVREGADEDLGDIVLD